MALLKKAASGVLAIFLCSRTEGTLRAQKGLRPCWTNFFEQRLAFGMLGLLAKMRLLTSAIFNNPLTHFSSLKLLEVKIHVRGESRLVLFVFLLKENWVEIQGVIE